MKKQFIRLVRTLLVLTILSLPVVMLAQTNMGMGNFNDCGPNDYYDDGGSATNYNDGQYYVETYCGAQPGDCIQFDFQNGFGEVEMDELGHVARLYTMFVKDKQRQNFKKIARDQARLACHACEGPKPGHP